MAGLASQPPSPDRLIDEPMTSPLRVLLALDGSDTALAAARCWSAWCDADARPMHAVLLAVVAGLPPGERDADPEQVARALAAMGAGRIDAARDLFSRSGLPFETVVRIGAPAALIVDEARRQRADLLVVGTRGLTPLRALLLGSVSLRVVQTSAIPVWLMPPHAPCPQALGRRLRLLVAVDGSDAACTAAAWAAHTAAWFGDVHVELCSVQPPFSPLEAMLDAAAGQFDHWSQRLGRAAIDAARNAMGSTGARIDAEVRTGETVETLLARADEIEADAIVVGPRGLGTVGQTLLGSVTSALLQTSRRAVVVVPGVP